MAAITFEFVKLLAGDVSELKLGHPGSFPPVNSFVVSVSGEVLAAVNDRTLPSAFKPCHQ